MLLNAIKCDVCYRTRRNNPSTKKQNEKRTFDVRMTDTFLLNALKLSGIALILEKWRVQLYATFIVYYISFVSCVIAHCCRDALLPRT
jgi:hypothetical protein